MRKYKLTFRHIGKHSYFDPSVGSCALTVEADNDDAAEMFGRRLASAMSDPEGDTIEFSGAESATESEE